MYIKQETTTTGVNYYTTMSVNVVPGDDMEQWQGRREGKAHISGNVLKLFQSIPLNMTKLHYN